jgi:hypothetical protein
MYMFLKSGELSQRNASFFMMVIKDRVKNGGTTIMHVHVLKEWGIVTENHVCSPH